MVDINIPKMDYIVTSDRRYVCGLTSQVIT